jgi:hypothetical protein
MSRRSITSSPLHAAATVVVVAGVLIATSAPVAARGITPSSVGSPASADFDGDGIGDLAIGIPEAKVGSHDGAGAVIVLAVLDAYNGSTAGYGSATTGFSSSNDQTLDLGMGLGLGLQPAHFGRALH